LTQLLPRLTLVISGLCYPCQSPERGRPNIRQSRFIDTTSQAVRITPWVIGLEYAWEIFDHATWCCWLVFLRASEGLMAGAPLISILITFLVIILVLYLVNRLPLDGRTRQIAQIIVIIIGIISLLKYLAVF
jgi:hypothetical protein